MKIDESDVARLEGLARLRLTDEARAGMARALEAILRQAERLGAVDTEGVPATYQPSDDFAPPRADEPRAWDGRRDAFENAPDADEGGFLVPRVLD